jgi:hypothetical protein
VDELKHAIHGVLASEEAVIIEDTQSVYHLLFALEKILSHGLKGKQ